MAARQHTVFSLQQCLQLGFSARAVQRRAEADRWHRIHRRVYSLVPPGLLTRRGHFMAAVLACGDGAVLSHEGAAELLGLTRPGAMATRASGPAGIHVTTPRRRRVLGATIHRSTTLIPGDRTRVDGIPCTSVARTLLDLGDLDDPLLLEHALDRAQASSRLRTPAIEDQLARNANRVAAGRLRAALAARRSGQAPSESALEYAFLAALRAAGVPAPERQEVMDLGDGEPMIRPDFMWRAQRLIIETDGHDTHGTWGAFESDRRRDQRLTRAGWRVVRMTWNQVTRDPRAVATLVRDLLGPATAG